MKKYILIVLIISFSPAWSQKKIVIRGVLITNNYNEYLTNYFSDSAFVNTFFNHLQATLEKKIGNVKMIYPNGKKITFIDPKLATSFSDPSIILYQDYIRQRTEAKKVDCDYIIEVKTDFNDTFKGKKSNIKITSKIRLKDARGRNIVYKSGKLQVIIPSPLFNSNNLLINQVELKQSFPIPISELRDAYIKSVNLAFEKNNRHTIYTSERPVVNTYDSFTNKAITYRLLAPVNFAKTGFKLKLQRFYTIAPKKSINVTRISDNKNGLLTAKESKITDINLGFGNKSRAYRFQRNFRVGIDMPDLPSPNYSVRGILSFHDGGIIGTGNLMPVKLKVKNKDEAGEGKEEIIFTNRNQNTDNLSRYNRSLGRVFCPFGKLEGIVSGKHLIVQSSTTSMNTLEVLIGGKLVALITHPVTTRKYLRKKRKLIPFILYVTPQLSIEDESLVLQSFQFNQLAYLLKDYQDHIISHQARAK
jgi:hypothetical protein